MDYYTQQTKPILDNVLNFLSADPRRRFIYAELSFFSLWWESLSESRKEQARKLVFPIIRFLIVCLLGYNKTVLYWVSLHYVDEFLN